MPDIKPNATYFKKKMKQTESIDNKAKTASDNAPEPVKSTVRLEASSPLFSTSDKIDINPSPDNLLQSVLWTEILGKPVSKRRGRW